MHYVPEFECPIVACNYKFKLFNSKVMQNRLAYLQSLFIRDTTLSYFFADAHHHQYACCGVMHAWPHGQWTRR